MNTSKIGQNKFNGWFYKKFYSINCKIISGVRLKEASLVGHHFVDKISHNVKNNFIVYYVIKHFFLFCMFKCTSKMLLISHLSSCVDILYIIIM